LCQSELLTVMKPVCYSQSEVIHFKKRDKGGGGNQATTFIRSASMLWGPAGRLP